jgi:hypothetical protein
MAVSGKYGKISIPRVGNDEPVFVLRVQDKLAPPAIGMHRTLVSSHGFPVAGDIQKVIDSFKDWKGRTKIPD